MGEKTRFSEAQFGAARREEQAAVRTTIVGGRPPGSGQRVGPIPRGVEVLVKKAAVDAEFREVLLERRAAAAGEIGLELDPAEALMLAAVPADQLRAIIQRTTVPQEHRRAFLGQAAAAMLAAVGGMVLGESAAESRDSSHVRGIRPQDTGVPRPDGAPDDAADDASTALLVRKILAKVAERDPEHIDRQTKLKADLALTAEQLEAVHQALEAEGELPLALDVLRELETVGQVIDYLEVTREVWQAVLDVLTERLDLPDGFVITADSSLVDDLKVPAEDLRLIHRELVARVRLTYVPLAFLTPHATDRQQDRVGDLVMLLASPLRRVRELQAKEPRKESLLPRPAHPRPVRGSRPDCP